MIVKNNTSRIEMDEEERKERQEQLSQILFEDDDDSDNSAPKDKINIGGRNMMQIIDDGKSPR